MSFREESWLPAAAVGYFVAALAWHASMASVGWTHAMSDLHGWRQAQTAITAYFIQQGGPWIAYETPVLGPPWRIPHEFPVYESVGRTFESCRAHHSFNDLWAGGAPRVTEACHGDRQGRYGHDEDPS